LLGTLISGIGVATTVRLLAGLSTFMQARSHKLAVQQPFRVGRNER
jgi:hypothetical protein